MSRAAPSAWSCIRPARITRRLLSSGPDRARCNARVALRRAACAGFADDYALLIAGLLDLYEAGGGQEWLAWALALQDVMDEVFWDPLGGERRGACMLLCC